MCTRTKKNEIDRLEASSLTRCEKGRETDGRFKKSWVEAGSLSTGLKGWLFNDESFKGYSKYIYIFLCLRHHLLHPT